ncbi:MAG: S8 family serine peptidase [Caldilineaceae bacterium]|nr:S8 family serine peptidase [Caldilineaceae bacterium]HRJ42667.1 S8 family serine peptidase [Caldilineaceae bacterium]
MENIALNWKKPILIVLLAILFWLSLQLINPVYAAAQPETLDNVVLVKFQPGLPSTERAALILEMGGQELRWIEALSTARIRLPESSASRTRDDTLALAHRSSAVRAVEFDTLVNGVPVFTEQMVDIPQAGNSTIPTVPVQVNDVDYNNSQMQVYAPRIINLPMAWNHTMGSRDIPIAILDTGILASHPEFAGRLLPGYDFVNNDADPHDDYGHGTHVAGIAAAAINNGVGMVGVCGNCSIIPVKVLNESNQGSWGNVAAGIVWSVNAGARVINLSLGGGSVPSTVEDAVRYATEHNVLIVAAAGNGRTNTPFYPAALEDVVGVAATRNDDTRWSLSNYGPFVELAAPGYAVYSTYNNLSNTYGGYIYMSGTSMAAPHVAGLAALLLSQNPNLTIAQLRELMRKTAADLGESGRDDYFGYGRIDVFAAIQAAVPPLQPNAAVGGIVWQDDNINGLQDQSERTVSDVLSIQVRDATDKLVGQAMPNGSGRWRVEKLYPGTYKVIATVLGNTLLTTPATYDIQLTNGQERTDVNFGTIQNDPVASSYRVYVPTIQGTR